jgi:hypothetical protein
MGLLEKFEDSLDRMVSGAFAKAFKAEVQPVELAAALQREMNDRASVLDRERTVVPNIFHIELSHHDFTRLAVFKDALGTELATLVRDYAGEQRYTLLGSVRVTMTEDDSLETGIFRVRSESRAEVVSAVPAVATVNSPSAEGVATGVAGSGGSAPTAQPQLEINGSLYPLARAITRLGRGTDTDIRIDDPGVSRHHCEIVLGTDIVLRDLGSTNGTWVNGARVTELVLTDGTAIQLGGTTLVFRSG